MGIVEHAIGTAPPAEHRELWLAARSVVRREVSRLVMGGLRPSDILVVIAEEGTVVPGLNRILNPEAIVQERAPQVTVLWGDQQRDLVVDVLGLEAYMARVPLDSFVVVVAPRTGDPMVAMSRTSPSITARLCL